MTPTEPIPLPHRRLILTLAYAGLAGCGGAAPHAHPASADAAPAAPAMIDAAVERDVERVRAVTSSFRAVDSSDAAGYMRAKQCLENPGQGAMGLHHVNRAVVDDKVELERPEILLYSRTPAGEYQLNGVEYIIPYARRSREAEPPTVMGQQLKRSDELRLWYLHVWVWQPNPRGLFADWNPAVKC